MVPLYSSVFYFTHGTFIMLRRGSVGFTGLPWASTAHAILNNCLWAEGRHEGGGTMKKGKEGRS